MFWTVLACKQCLICADFSPDSVQMTFKNSLMMDLFLTNMQRLASQDEYLDGLEWCGLFVDYCDIFISCLDSHPDGTHSLQWTHWRASDVMLDSSKSVPMKKQNHLHLSNVHFHSFKQ